MKFKKIVSMLLLSFGLMVSVSASYTEAAETQKNNANRSHVSQAVILSKDNYNEAVKAYKKARFSRDEKEAKLYYRKVIMYIKEAVMLDKNNPKAWLLGAHLYNVCGERYNAELYFNNAYQIYENKLRQNPNSIRENLDLAIVVYIGAPQDLPNYEEYKNESIACAKKVLRIMKKRGGYIQGKIVAYIILNQHQKIGELRRSLKPPKFRCGYAVYEFYKPFNSYMFKGKKEYLLDYLLDI